MKYKNIELLDGEDSCSELLCSVEFENEDCDDEFIEDMEEKLIDLFEDFEEDVYTECVTDNIIQIRSDDITFDKEGIKLLKSIHDKLIGAKLDAKVTIDTYVDGDVCFTREDGSEYNEDEALTWEEFIGHLEY